MYDSKSCTPYDIAKHFAEYIPVYAKVCDVQFRTHSLPQLH